MSVMTFDTLEYANQLKAANVPEAQAQVQARALRQVLETQSTELATKADIAMIHKDIEALEQRTKTRFTLLQWMLAGVLGGVGTILLKLFWG